MENYREIAKYTLEALKIAGAEKAECFLNANSLDEISAEGNKFNLMRSTLRSNLEMKAIIGKKAGRSVINRLNKESIDIAAKACVESVFSSNEDDAEDISEKIGNADFKSGVFEPDIEVLIKRIVELTEDIKKEYPNIIYDAAGLYTLDNEVYVNTNGVELTNHYGKYTVVTGFVAKEGEQATSFGPGCQISLNNPDIKLIDYGNIREEIKKAISLLNPKPVQEKFNGTILVSPSFLGQLIFYLSNIALRDGVLISGTSQWKNLIGKKVANDCLTVSSLPFDERILCGQRITPDGYKTENIDIIKDGILNSYLLSQYGAKITGLSRAGNSGYDICVKPGNTKLEDIIKNTKKGIYINRFSGRSPFADGEISGVAKNSFMIEDGKITNPIADTMITGNLFDMLNNISFISSEVQSDSASVLPWVAFDGVTIK